MTIVEENRMNPKDGSRTGLQPTVLFYLRDNTCRAVRELVYGSRPADLTQCLLCLEYFGACISHLLLRLSGVICLLSLDVDPTCWVLSTLASEVPSL